MKRLTLGELRASSASRTALEARSVKDEMRENLMARLREGGPIFPGVLGYEETVVPQVVNAILARHDMILLGLRGQAKSRILRQLSTFLDEEVPVIEGCEINDDPFRPICRRCRDLIEREGDRTPVTMRTREERYIEKLATPDVTIADMIGDIDPIKAARGGHALASELTIHYGLLPRANRGIFAINELPDLAARIQVGLFNIMQEGDVQIKGYPLRLPLDVVLVFSANPEDYTARGKIVTPLKDRIGAEIRTHYPATLAEGVEITAQESWIDRGSAVAIPSYIREIVEAVAFRARSDQRVDKRSGVSQRMPISCLETVVSNAERRALTTAEPEATARVLDVYSALPSITGKLELEYEGELKGAESIARDLIRQAIQTTFRKYFPRGEFRRVTDWFESGRTLQISDSESAAETIERFKDVDGLMDLLATLGVDEASPLQAQASGAEFVLEGLSSIDKISRSEGGEYSAADRKGIEDIYRDYAMDPKRFKKPLN